MTSWQRPTEAQIRQVELLLLHPQEERHFFTQLENPLWIDALCDRATMAPPSPEINDNGGVSHRQWPFSAYLARVAGEHPDHARVAAIIAELGDTENIFVRNDLIRAMTGLDPCAITELLPFAIEWVAERPQVLPTADLIGELAIQAVGCRANDGLVRALLVAQFGTRTAGSARPYRGEGFDWWETKEFAKRLLPDLVERNWEVTVGALLDDLEQSIADQLEGEQPASEGYDLTDWWLSESIDGGEFWEAGNPIAFLAARSLDVVAHLPAASPDAVMRLVDRGEWAVLERLRLRYWSARAAAGMLEPPMLAALADPRHVADYQPCPEYDSLLKAAFVRGSADVRDAILKALASSAAAGGDHGDYWHFGRLAVIAGDLPKEAQQRFEQFIESLGAPPERETRTSVGFESPAERNPLEPNQSESMSAVDLASYARDWTEPEGDWFEQPTWKGLAAEIEREAQRRPVEFSQAAGSFADVERTVVSALLRGLEAGVRDGSPIEWAPTLQLIRLIAPQNEAIGELREHRFGRDVSWSEAKRAATELMQTALGPDHSLPLELMEPLWRTIEALAAEGEDMAYEPADDVHDSVFAALNSTRSRTVYTAVRYLLWLRRNEIEAPPSTVRVFFDRILDPSTEPFVGMRAAVAHKLPQLAYVNASWVTQLLPDIFPAPGSSAEHWRAAWDAYLRHSAPTLSRTLLKEMKPNYRAAVRQVDHDHQITGRDDRVVLLGIHLAAMFLRSDVELDDSELVEFFARATGPVRTRVYGWIGRVASQQDLPDSWYDRVRQFVEWREDRVEQDALEAEELRMLGWLVASGKFPVEWWGRRLAAAIGSNADYGEGYIPLEEMMREVAKAAASYPEMALDVLEVVVEQDRFERHRPYLEHANAIVMVGMQDSGLARRARRVADMFARAGFVEFEQFSVVGG